MLPDSVIDSVAWSNGAIGSDNMAALTGGSAAAQKAPPHCVVSGEIGAHTGADGKHYGIKFQLRLPANWNQRFLFQGGGQAYDDFDPLTALENRQDKGEAPNQLPARCKAFPNQEMPLCAYPQVATYQERFCEGSRARGLPEKYPVRFTR